MEGQREIRRYSSHRYTRLWNPWQENTQNSEKPIMHQRRVVQRLVYSHTSRNIIVSIKLLRWLPSDRGEGWLRIVLILWMNYVGEMIASTLIVKLTSSRFLTSITNCTKAIFHLHPCETVKMRSSWANSNLQCCKMWNRNMSNQRAVSCSSSRSRRKRQKTRH